MNTKNNKRKKESAEKIKQVFFALINEKPMNKITVSEICSLAQINRSTFYAAHEDIFVLAASIRCELEQIVWKLYEDKYGKRFNTNDYLLLFHHIKENQLLYKTYFKLGFADNEPNLVLYEKEQTVELGASYIDYHIEFFKNGFNAIVKKWLNGGCIETPEEMNEILLSEYKGRLLI